MHTAGPSAWRSCLTDTEKNKKYIKIDLQFSITCDIITKSTKYAGMAELADALDSGTNAI